MQTLSTVKSIRGHSSFGILHPLDESGAPDQAGKKPWRFATVVRDVARARQRKNSGVEQI
jgi:hypothetical protein